MSAAIFPSCWARVVFPIFNIGFPFLAFSILIFLDISVISHENFKKPNSTLGSYHNTRKKGYFRLLLVTTIA